MRSEKEKENGHVKNDSEIVLYEHKSLCIIALAGNREIVCGIYEVEK